jgi:hypothetical protein
MIHHWTEKILCLTRNKFPHGQSSLKLTRRLCCATKTESPTKQTPSTRIFFGRLFRDYRINNIARAIYVQEIEFRPSDQLERLHYLQKGIHMDHPWTKVAVDRTIHEQTCGKRSFDAVSKFVKMVLNHLGCCAGTIPPVLSILVTANARIIR